ncbi:SusD/RagB family nutrient-binding outer membrane lipoprotein [Chitinophaga nivalis]|uniref:SusD/RagB family nutrient-binding outer membrane lipoprotein n=1 Tax=Chitinophaga nivalis TaxID=2991709 RepID=A0ABT3IN97_9BACT|nr:SusD/RagB family nutrient-binding outer membrane lipoprotein [Chitinophaga nivalis]MCW3464880.1 SusD/RagB family nutrient-binding outer membrane lipoprotein [Chitinophaga nivalis]MCW3485429.1 SusD/RagB family nutrient-binding outer membrane lipoprotein [Chitinophaga nivalis]
MQRFAKYTFLLLTSAVLGLASCDKGFEKMNINPNAAEKPNVDLLFTQSLLKGNLPYDRGYFYTSYLNCGNFIQHFATAKEIAGAGCGDKYAVNDFYQSFYFRYIYTNAITTLGEIINAAQAPENVNKLSATRIWKVLLMQRITDLYGDVPYSDAIKGRSNVFQPKYDTQADIYADMLKELDEAIKAFDNSKPTFGSADLLYNGNIAQWKKFGYSLMLRVAMRTTKVTDGKIPTKDWALKAIAGGVITEGTDNAVLRYTNGPQTYNNNPIAFELASQDYVTGAKGKNNTEWGKFSKTFIDFLKTQHDPRLGVVAVVWNNGVADTSAAIQQGMPNGTDKKGADFVTFSEPNPATILQYGSPLLLLTNAETNLLMSEVALRGWGSGDKAQLFRNGVTAALRNWALFGPAGTIAPAKIDQFVNDHPLTTTGNFDAQMNQIHSQFWAALLLDEHEAYANWRRTGYPQLTPVNYIGNATGGIIPRRFPYSQAEQGINAANYNAAISRQGPDLLTTRIWWDK